MNTNENSTSTSNENITAPAPHPLFNEDHRATYCPEDNKLRLYVGRVPREQYLKLRSEGWVALHKQRETGGGDFAATWTPSRRDTALAYAGIIEDEDMSPAERAADRAERFSGYREKRTAEACGHADRYEEQPAAHGFQDAKKAERAVSRHEKIGDRAGDAWSKAEYWQQRTAGVISHALYKSTPGVRMGRIKELEADIRQLEGRTDAWGVDWLNHAKLRLSYEMQMLEAQGGRAAFVEMEVGGWIGNHQIRKVNKSPATGRVVSVTLKIPGDRWGNSREGFHMRAFNVERLSVDAYRPPTAEDKAALQDLKKSEKASAPAKAPCPLINPTLEDALKLQDIWNKSEREASAVLCMTQAQYSARSGGTYSPFETVIVNEHGTQKSSGWRMVDKSRCEIFKVRKAPSTGFNSADRVIVITDKPQKPLPWAEMQAAKAMQPTRAGMIEKMPEIQAALAHSWFDDSTREILCDAAYAGLVYVSSQSQIGWTDAGFEEFKKYQAALAPVNA